MLAIVKFCVSFLLLLVLTKADDQTPNSSQDAPIVIPEIPNVSKNGKAFISSASSIPFQNCTDRWETQCWDCHNIVICAGAETPIYQGACHHLTPYCDSYSPYKHQCAKNLNDPLMEEMCDANPQTATQVCTSAGYFPDINNARVYFNCDSPSHANPRRYECPEDYIFDTIKHTCKRIIPFDCTGKNNEFILHAYNPAYYAYCRVNGGTLEIIPYRCRDDRNFAFNLHTKTCEYQCKEEGQFVDRESCENYYECYRNGNQLTSKRKRCGAMGQMEVFSKTQGSCIPYMQPCYPELGWM